MGFHGGFIPNSFIPIVGEGPLIGDNLGLHDDVNAGGVVVVISGHLGDPGVRFVPVPPRQGVLPASPAEPTSHR